MLLLAVLGTLPLAGLHRSDPSLHRQLAPTKRRRRPAIAYPIGRDAGHGLGGLEERLGRR